MFDVNITFPFEAILLPLKAETGINAIFTSGVPLSLEYERLCIVVARRRSSSSHCKIENRLMGLIRKLVSLRNQKVTTLVKFPSKETRYMLILLVGLLLLKNKQANKSQKL